MRLYLATRIHRIRHRYGGGVKHLARHAHQARISRRLQPEDPIADYRRSYGREMSAYLVCAPSLYPDPQKTRVWRLGFARNLGYGGLAIERRIYDLVRKFELADDYRMVGLGDLVGLEHLYGRGQSRMALREDKTTSGVAIESVDGLKRRYVLLDAQYRLSRLRIVAADDAGRLVRDKVLRNKR